MAAKLLTLAEALSLDSLSKSDSVGKCPSGCCRFYAIGEKAEDSIVVQLEAKIDYNTLLPRFVVIAINDENYENEDGTDKLWEGSAATPEFAEMWSAITVRVKKEREEEKAKALAALKADPAVAFLSELLGAAIRR